MSAQQHEFDDIDLLLHGSLQHKDDAETAHERVWSKLRERIEHETQQELAALAQQARYCSYRDPIGRICCHWHVLETTVLFPLKFGFVR